MAGNVPAIEAGFEYQWIYGWYRVLDLVGSAGRVESVAIEDPEAGLFDDVTIRPRADTGHPAEFLQVKFHVELSDFYSATSTYWLRLLPKAWRTWGILRTEFANIELVLVTTWAWDPTDVVRIGDRRLAMAFVDGTTTDGNALASRAAWRALLGDPSDDEFVAFLRSLRFRTSYDEKTELLDRTRERMGWLGLRTDDEALRIGSDIVRQWVIDKKVRVTRTDLERAIEKRELRERVDEPSVTLFVHTIRKMPMETTAEYELDWRDAFEGPDDERGHLLVEPQDWNGRLLPELRARARRIEQETPARLLRVRGLSRLSPWFAVGFTFRETTGWEIEAQQGRSLWRTDAPASNHEPVVHSEDLAGDHRTVALSIGVTGDPTEHVRYYLEASGNPAGRLIAVQTPRKGREAIRSAGDLVRLADVVKAQLQRLVPRAKRVLLFYWGPLSGAVFIGHALNAVAGEIQLHEEKNGEYFPSFTLH